MTSKTLKAVPVATGTDLRNCDLAKINSEHIRLETLRAQYLAEIFALPASTAVTVAELAFGEAR
ncbi:hypothetical protein QY049_03240 [Bradyrhizobium sp. WYCCWR 13022]|uniref:hypothetical protein n=1 Tax=unclassified Bradyrhizobium TaxID=2631580 RepID=UPI00263B696D|nr:hypothetical protein [Bradyrhizobium sp. WYCCWR 13022]MDN4982240.1 hypothetical protein [Bradyrhizobium sp. WYCCWR 13022]